MKQSFSPILQKKVFIQNDRAYIAKLNLGFSFENVS